MPTYIEILKPGRCYVSKRVTSRDINVLGIEFEKMIVDIDSITKNPFLTIKK